MDRDMTDQHGRRYMYLDLMDLLFDFNLTEYEQTAGPIANHFVCITCHLGVYYTSKTYWLFCMY